MIYKVKDVAEEISVRIDNPAESKYSKFVGLEHYDSGEMVIKRYGSTDNLESSMKMFQSGDVLLARRNVYLRRAGVVDFDGLTSGDSIVLRPKETPVKKLLPFILNTDDFWNYANKNADGSMSKRLSPKLLLDYTFVIPDDLDINKISTCLWSIEKTRASYKELLKQTEEITKSRFVEMFGDPFENTRYKYKRVDELTTVVSGGTPDRNNDVYWTNGNIPWIKTTELKNQVIQNSEEFITDTGLSNSSAKIVPIGTILIAMYGQGKTRGMTGMLGIKASTNQACACVLPSKNINQEYLWNYLILSYDKLRSLSKGGNQQNLNAKLIKEFPILIPPIDLQNQFSDFVHQVDKSKLSLNDTLDKLTELRKSIYSNTVRGLIYEK